MPFFFLAALSFTHISYAMITFIQMLKGAYLRDKNNILTKADHISVTGINNLFMSFFLFVVNLHNHLNFVAKKCSSDMHLKHNNLTKLLYQLVYRTCQ